MQRIDGTGVAAAKPAYGADVAPGYFTEGNPTIPIAATEVTQDWANHIQEELVALATLRGAALSRANDNQAFDALKHTQALTADAADTALVTTPWERAVLASSRAQSSGADSAVIASGDTSAASRSKAEGARTCVIASDRGQVIAGGGGGDCAVVAVTFTKVNNAAGGVSNAAAVGCAGGTVDGSQSVAVAATNPDVDHDQVLATGNSPRSGIAGERVHSSGEITTGKACQIEEITKSGRTFNAGPTTDVLGPDFTFAVEGSYLVSFDLAAVEQGGGVGGDYWGDAGKLVVHWDGVATLVASSPIITGTAVGTAAALANFSMGIAAVGAQLQFTASQGAYANDVNWGGFFRILRVDA